MDLQTKILVNDLIAKNISKELCTNDVSDQEKVKQVLENAVSKLVDKKMLDGADDTDVKVTILWESYTWKDKAMWYLCNRVFPSIAADARQTVNRLSNEINDKLWELGEEPFVGTSQDCLPRWAIQSPRTVLVTDFKVRPVQALEYVTLKFEVKK